MSRRARVGGEAVMTRSDEGGGRAPKFGNRLARIAIADPDRVRRVFWYQPADQRLRARLCASASCRTFRQRRERPSRHSRARQMSTEVRSMRYLGVRTTVLAARSRGEVVG